MQSAFVFTVAIFIFSWYAKLASHVGTNTVLAFHLLWRIDQVICNNMACYILIRIYNPKVDAFVVKRKDECFYSQWWGLGGSSLGCATVELAKLLNAAEEGLMQRGTRFEFIWLSINRWSLSFTLLTQVKSLSHSSSKALSATGS